MFKTAVYENLYNWERNYLWVFVLDHSDDFLPVIWFGGCLSEDAFVSFFATVLGQSVVLDYLSADFYQTCMEGLEFARVSCYELLLVLFV